MPATAAAANTLSYSITDSNRAGRFAINGSTVAVTVAGSLAYETQLSYSPTLRVEDGHGGLDTATANVSVTDVDETAPVATLWSATMMVGDCEEYTRGYSAPELQPRRSAGGHRLRQGWDHLPRGTVAGRLRQRRHRDRVPEGPARRRVGAGLGRREHRTAVSEGNKFANAFNWYHDLEWDVGDAITIKLTRQ